jgi:dienelactone hydrolase
MGDGTVVEEPRPIRMTIWYPAASSASAQPVMSFGGYVRYPKEPRPFAAANEFLSRRDSVAYLVGDFAGSKSLLKKLMMTPTAAHPGAPSAPGRFPLVVYAAGWNSLSPDNTVLTEYLASSGFVVVTVPQLPTHSTDAELLTTPGDLETQLRDLEIALGAVRDEHDVDATNVFLIGYSMGGIESLWLAARHQGIGAIVGLDPSFMYREWQELAERPGFFDVRAIHARIMVLTSAQHGVASSRITPVLDSLRFADRYLAEVDSTDHGSFSDYPMLIASVAPAAPISSAPAMSTASSRRIMETTRAFLELAVAHRSSGAPFELSHGLGTGMTRLAGVEVPTVDDILIRLRTAGYDSVRVHLERLERRYPTLDIVDERSLNAAGYAQLQVHRPTTATEIFRLNTILHPHSANTFDSLADGLLALGDTTAAAAAYRRALAVDSAYANARAARAFVNAHGSSP